MYQRLAGEFEGRGDKVNGAKYYKLEQELGKKIRRLLRKKGYVDGCEIDSYMELEASQLFYAWDKLHSRILDNSPVIADKLAQLGDKSLRNWQDAHQTPIRPDRRN